MTTATTKPRLREAFPTRYFGHKTERSHLRKYTRITFLFFDTRQLSHAAIAITSKSAKTFSLYNKHFEIPTDLSLQTLFRENRPYTYEERKHIMAFLNQ